MSKMIALAAGALLAGSVTAAIPAHASKYSVVYSFQGGTDGANPFSGLTKLDGTLYGVTYVGGTSGNGTAFGVTPAGSETMLYSFQGGADGANPWGGMLNVDGTLFGTTYGGGDGQGNGTLFSMTPAGVKTVLHTFTRGNDGAAPIGGLVKSGTALYGTTAAGGNGIDCGFTQGCGTVFKLSHKGVYSQVYRFNHDDANSPLGTLLPFNDELYGTSFQGGDINNPLGSVYKTTKDGTETVLHKFGVSPDGADPVGGLINVDGTFYGTTESGGANQFGSVFSVTPAGVVTVLYSFKAGDNDGQGPQAALIYVNGALYGTTGNGGPYGTGIVFKVTLDGTETVIHKFGPYQAGPDGSVPLSNLIKLGGRLYGTTYGGGTGGTGTVFEIKP